MISYHTVKFAKVKRATVQDLTQHISVLKRNGIGAEEGMLLLMKLQLIKLIKYEIEKRNWSQREAAKFLKVAQPRVAEISGFCVDKFSVELLLKYLHRLGLKVSMKVKSPKVPVRDKRRAVNSDRQHKKEVVKKHG